MSRLNELARQIPPTTFACIALCCSLHLFQMLADIPLHHVTMCPRNVLYLFELYRMVTSSLFHGGLMHIAMNMMSTLALSTLLEKQMGTLRHLLSILWAILMTNVVYILVSYLLSTLFAYDDLMFQHAVGFSGVLFHLLVLESNLLGQQESYRSVFGVINVPSWSYPWVLLVALQFILPNLSLLGHLAGIVTGSLQLYGFFEWFAIPDETTLKEMDQWTSLRLLSRGSNYVATPSGRDISRSPSDLCHSVRRGVLVVKQYTGYLLETVIVFILGRGNSVNSNIQVAGGWMLSPRSLLSVGENQVDDNDDDDDDWGLPRASTSRDTISETV